MAWGVRHAVRGHRRARKQQRKHRRAAHTSYSNSKRSHARSHLRRQSSLRHKWLMELQFLQGREYLQESQEANYNISKYVASKYAVNFAAQTMQITKETIERKKNIAIHFNDPFQSSNTHDINIINEIRSMHQYYNSYDPSPTKLNRSILPPDSSNFSFVPWSLNKHTRFFGYPIFMETKYKEKSYKALEASIIHTLDLFDQNPDHQLQNSNLCCLGFCCKSSKTKMFYSNILEQRIHALADHLHDVNGHGIYVERGIEISYIHIGNIEGLIFDVSPWDVNGDANIYWDGERPVNVHAEAEAIRADNALAIKQAQQEMENAKLEVQQAEEALKNVQTVKANMEKEGEPSHILLRSLVREEEDACEALEKAKEKCTSGENVLVKN